MAKIVNIRNHRQDGSTVRIDRQTKWGNPFGIGPHGTRAQVIELYRLHLAQQIRTGQVSLEDLAALDGKTLACWCAPRPCHGDVLARAAKWAADQLPG